MGVHSDKLQQTPPGVGLTHAGSIGKGSGVVLKGAAP